MRIKTLLALSTLVLFTLPAFAQKKPDAPPQLTQVEQLELQNLQLKFELAQQQLQQIQQQYATIVNAISSEHPGWTFDAASYQFVKATQTASKK